MYCSTYLERLSKCDNSAYYHRLTGEFLIFKSKRSINIIEEHLNNGECTKAVEEVLEVLERKGLFYNDEINEEEEFKLLENYWVVINPDIFGSWNNDEFVLTIPYPKNIKKLRLSKSEGENWIKITENQHMLKDVIKKIPNILQYGTAVKGLFKLISDIESSDDTKIFANLYLGDYKNIEEANQDSEEAGKVEGPSSLFLKVTDACNLNCKMCGQAINKSKGLIKGKDYLDFDQLKKFTMDGLEGLKYVYLWGGEPLLHPGIGRYIEYFKGKEKYVSIATNGTMLKKHADFIVKSGVDEVAVSIDGPEKVHNEIRGREDTFKLLEEGIKRINELKKSLQVSPKLVINCTITEDNFEYLYDVLEIAKNMNVSKIIFQMPMFISKAEGEKYSRICESKWGVTSDSWVGFDKKYHIDTDEFYKFYLFIKNNHRGFAEFYNIDFESKEDVEKYFAYEGFNSSKNKCAVLNSAMVVEQDGNIVMCPDFPDVKQGNIMDRTVLDFWKDDFRKEFKGIFNENEKLPICDRCCHFL